MDDKLQAVESAEPQKQTLSEVSEAVEQLWALPPSQWALGPGEVHIWSALLDQPKTRTLALAAALSEEEKGKAARFRFDKIRERWVVGRGVLRHILGGYTGWDPSEICFEYGAQGKPAFARPARAFHFNFSHSGNLALCAVCRQEPVGVDVERIRFMAEAAPIAQQCFSRDEQMEFHCASIGEKQRMFYRIWTRKEAVLKWSGRGISHMEETLARESSFKGFLHELKPAAGYIGCLAMGQPPEALQLWRWP